MVISIKIVACLLGPKLVSSTSDDVSMHKENRKLGLLELSFGAACG